MFEKGWPLPDHVIPAPQVRHVRHIEIEQEPTMNVRADGDIAHGEPVACHERRARQLLFDYLQRPQQRLPARLNAAGAEGLQSGACESAPAALEKILVLSTGQGGQNTAILLQRTP